MSDINELKTKPLMSTTRHLHKQIDMLADFSQIMKYDKKYKNY